MHIELICVGSELLAGKINTHGRYFSCTLNTIGLTLKQEHTVSDSINELAQTVQAALERSDIVFITGGLGPTFDDITREAVSQAIETPLCINKKLLAYLTKKLASYKRTLSSFDKRQATIIDGAHVIYNRIGIAPGQMIHINNKHIFLLPGPFHELQPMVEKTIIPYLKSHICCPTLCTTHIQTFGLVEADIDKLIRPIIEQTNFSSLYSVSYTILASLRTVSLTVRLQGPSHHYCTSVIRRIKNSIYHKLGDYIFSEDESEISDVVAALLKKKNQTIAVAESCTGGLLSSMLTSQSGSSLFFKQGLIVYSNESKIKLLDISPLLIKHHGAVSEQVARMMADKIRVLSATDYGIAITGIAGPTGATKKKPVGLVYIACASARLTLTVQCHFPGNRASIQERAAVTACDILRRCIQQAPLPKKYMFVGKV